MPLVGTAWFDVTTPVPQRPASRVHVGMPAQLVTPSLFIVPAMSQWFVQASEPLRLPTGYFPRRQTEFVYPPISWAGTPVPSGWLQRSEPPLLPRPPRQWPANPCEAQPWSLLGPTIDKWFQQSPVPRPPMRGHVFSFVVMPLESVQLTQALPWLEQSPPPRRLPTPRIQGEAVEVLIPDSLRLALQWFEQPPRPLPPPTRPIGNLHVEPLEPTQLGQPALQWFEQPPRPLRPTRPMAPEPGVVEPLQFTGFVPIGWLLTTPAEPRPLLRGAAPIGSFSVAPVDHRAPSVAGGYGVVIGDIFVAGGAIGDVTYEGG